MEFITRELTWKEKIKGHITGPVGSIVFHIFLIFGMIKFLTGDSGVMVKQTPVEIKLESKPIEIEKIKEIEVKEVREITQDIDMTMPTEAFAMDVTAPVTETASTAPDSNPVDLENLDIVSNVDSPVTIVGIMQGRTKAGRAAGLAKFGGNQATENAVIRALEWLKRNQEKDGSWPAPSGHKIGLTGLAVLTFLAHGETPASDKYGQTVEKGIQYLISKQRDDGHFPGGGNSYVYEHAIATYALADSYSMTRIPLLKEKLEKSAEIIIKGQQPKGGWDYGYKVNSPRTDSSVIAWQVQALKASLIAGATNKGLLDALHKSLDGMRMLYQSDTGNFDYTNEGRRTNPGLTALGALTFQFVGQKESPEARKALIALNGVKADYNVSGWPYYAWYYITQAKFNEQSTRWKTWNPQIAKFLVTSQAKDGHWESVGGERSYGPVYATTLGALCLQVYYRLLPTFGEQALAVPVQPAGFEDNTDITVEL